MTTQEIYSLANELSEKEIQNVLNEWTKDNEIDQISKFNSLVSFGDSSALALATTISEKYNSVEKSNLYLKAYSI